MSGIAGIFCLDGGRADERKLSKMARALVPRGPDGIRIWVGGAVGLVHGHFYTTPEELGEEQPISDSAEENWIAADARIDNRAELISQLGAFQSKVPTDAELILSAYKKWHQDCPRYLIGDFAFAIWDAGRQELFCARDPAGVRLLAYGEVEGEFIFASSLEGIVAALDYLPEVNRPFIEDLLAGRYGRWVNETAYRGLFRLPPCYHLTASSKGIRLGRYWVFGAGPRIRFDTEEEYVLRFREIFRQAVVARMRSVGPIAITAGGGVDASSVACLVNDMIAAGEISISGRIFCSVYENTPQADERDFIEILLKRCPQLKSILVVSDDLWALRELEESRNYPLYDPEVSMMRAQILALLHRIRAQGCRVLLSGHFADHLLNRDAYHNPILLKDLSLDRIAHELPIFREVSGSLYNIAAQQLIFPKIPLPVKKMLRKCVHGPPTFLIGECKRPCSDPLLPPPLSFRSSKLIYHSLMDGIASSLHVQIDNMAAYTGLDWRLPYLDRRMIEFALSLPPQMTFRDGFTKFILRKSMRELPKEIRWRISRTHLGELEDRGLMEMEKEKVTKLLEDSELARECFISQPDLMAAWNRYWTASYPIQPLRRSLCAECWLRYYSDLARH
jgi:asparagine synthase (glutamine-hydrolysing)